MSDDPAIVPCVRERIEKEFADGQLAVRVKIDQSDIEAFWTAFPDIDQSAYLANSQGAIECTRGALMREFADGSLAIRILVEPHDKPRFRELWPTPGSVAVMARESPEVGRSRMQEAAATADPEPQYGAHAQTLRTYIKFMGATKVWCAVGSDEEYLKWLRTLPCAHCKWTPHWEMDTFVPSEAAHVRRVASGSGTAIKPNYSAIPLCPNGHGHSCHRKQHDQGERYLGGKEKVDKLRMHYIHTWVWETLKAQLGYEHWNECPPETLVAWASANGVLDCLPKIYLQNL